MRPIRWVVLVLALPVLIVSILLLLNFTAPNPTGRRYSSEMPLTSGQGTDQQIGADAERVLAQDLGLPNNNAPDQRRCFCSSASSGTPGGCNVCVVSAPLRTPTYRIPDFVAWGLIAESKNRRVWDASDLDQIRDCATGAQALGVPLWVYVRVDTQVDPAYHPVVAETGGDIVYYFAVPGYVDPVDRVAVIGLLASLVVLGVGGAWEGVVIILHTRRPSPGPSSPGSRRRKDSSNRAARKVDHAETFLRDTQETARRRLDEDKTRDDWREP